MFKFLSSFVLGVSLLMPVTVVYAQDHDHHEDSAREHHWDDSQNQYWHQYLKEHHKKDHDWEKANKREQENYWKWRDQHRDDHH